MIVGGLLGFESELSVYPYVAGGPLSGVGQ